MSAARLMRKSFSSPLAPMPERSPLMSAQKHRNAGFREAFSQNLQRDRLARTSCAGHQTMPVAEFQQQQIRPAGRCRRAFGLHQGKYCHRPCRLSSSRRSLYPRYKQPILQATMAKDFFVSGKLRMAGEIPECKWNRKIQDFCTSVAVPMQETCESGRRNFTRPIAI